MEQYGRQTVAGLMMGVNSQNVLVCIKMLWQEVLKKSTCFISIYGVNERHKKV